MDALQLLPYFSAPKGTGERELARRLGALVDQVRREADGAERQCIAYAWTIAREFDRAFDPEDKFEARVFCREYYANGDGVAAHLSNVGRDDMLETLARDYALSWLELHGPRAEENAKAEQQLLPLGCHFFVSVPEMCYARPGKYSARQLAHAAIATAHFRVHDLAGFVGRAESGGGEGDGGDDGGDGGGDDGASMLADFVRNESGVSENADRPSWIDVCHCTAQNPGSPEGPAGGGMEGWQVKRREEAAAGVAHFVSLQMGWIAPSSADAAETGLGGAAFNALQSMANELRGHGDVAELVHLEMHATPRDVEMVKKLAEEHKVETLIAGCEYFELFTDAGFTGNGIDVSHVQRGGYRVRCAVS